MTNGSAFECFCFVFPTNIFMVKRFNFINKAKCVSLRSPFIKCGCCRNHRFQVVAVLLPSASVYSTPSSDLQLGDKAKLHCTVSSPVKESEVQWWNPDGIRYPGSQVADLTSVTRSDAGQWNCKFSHEGMTYSQSLDIKVTGRTLASPKLLSDFNSN